MTTAELLKPYQVGELVFKNADLRGGLILRGLAAHLSVQGGLDRGEVGERQPGGRRHGWSTQGANLWRCFP